MITYYDSIMTLPIYNFDVLCKNNDPEIIGMYLAKQGHEFPKDVDEVELWSNIYNEFLEEYGLSDKFKKYLRLRIKATRLYNEALLEGKKHKITFAKLADLQALDAIKESNEGDLGKTSASLSKYYGFRINPMEISVKEYYDYIHQAQKENGN